MSCDYDYHKRMAELAALMLAHPRTRMKKLQKALHGLEVCIQCSCAGQQ